MEALFVVLARDVVRDVVECSIRRCAFLKFRRESSYGIRRSGWSWHGDQRWYMQVPAVDEQAADATQR